MGLGAGLLIAIVVLVSLSISKVRHTAWVADLMTTKDGMSVAHPTAGPAFVNSPGIARSADDARRPIAPVLPPGNFGCGTVDAVIATGLYFKREWAAAIHTSVAVSGPFTLCDGACGPIRCWPVWALAPQLCGVSVGGGSAGIPDCFCCLS